MTAPMIAIATNNGDIGGGEVMLLNIAHALRDLGIGVSVIAPTEPGELLVTARRRGFQTIALRADDRPQYIAALRSWRRRHRDVPLWCNGLVPSFATAGQGPRLAHLHILPTGLNAIAAQIASLGARRVLVPSGFMAARVPGAAVLANWTEEIPFRVRAAESSGPLRVGFLGRLTREKGVDVLARAMDRIAASTARDMRLVLAGENRFGGDEDDQAIDAALEPILDRVERTGWVERDDFFEDIDLAVFPSVVHETFGLVVAEAMAAGVPFVISNAGALHEVAGSHHPWVARHGDDDDLARVICSAAEEIEQGDGPRARSARCRWEQEFSPQAGKERVAAMVRDLPARPRASQEVTGP